MSAPKKFLICLFAFTTTLTLGLTAIVVVGAVMSGVIGA